MCDGLLVEREALMLLFIFPRLGVGLFLAYGGFFSW